MESLRVPDTRHRSDGPRISFGILAHMASSGSSAASGEPTDSAGTSRDVSDMEGLQATIQRERYAGRYWDLDALLPRLPPRLELPHLVLGHLVREITEQQDLAALDEMGSALSSVWTHPDAPDHLVRALTDRLRLLPIDASLPAGLLQALAIHSGPRFFSNLQEAFDDARWLQHDDRVSWALYMGVSTGADHISRWPGRRLRSVRGMPRTGGGGPVRVRGHVKRNI